MAEEPHAALTDEVKAEIQDAYTSWLAARDFKPRIGQRQMIAEIARALGAQSNRLCIVEAGTGTGKTVAYCLAAIPLARALDKRIVIATATVALQEQVAFRDLPDIRRYTGLEFASTLAKGRGRYVCLKRLEDHMTFDESREAQLFEPPDARALATYGRLRNAFSEGSWDGDRDSWEEGIDVQTWRGVTNDRAGCGASRCSYYHQCPFFKARQQVGEADVVVANHDLVLADLGLGGGVVLPDPAQTIYIVDEAHHLPGKTRSHFTRAVRLKATNEWLTQVTSSIETMARRFNEPRELKRARDRLADDAGEIRNQLADVERMLRDLPFDPRDKWTGIHRFVSGEVPTPLAELSRPLGQAFGAVAAILAELREHLDDAMDGTLDWDNAEQAQTWLPVVSQLAGRAEGGEALFRDFGDAQGRSAARWVLRRMFDSSDDIELTSAPLDPGDILASTLWEACYGAVATSATLCALGSFERFQELAGISEAGQTRIASPFDFPNIATFSVPRMQSDPRDAPAHTEEFAAMLPDLLGLERSALVLFTSWRQFDAVAESLPASIRDRCRLQDTAPKQRLVAEHCAAIDAGEESYLFGLASFAEGVDLPGDYCRHVIIAKIPFAVPDDPVDQALAERLEEGGRNPFFEISMPDASLRLVQACGRLIRHENDGGRITLLDRRIVTRQYGQALLESLPPYRREVH